MSDAPGRAPIASTPHPTLALGVPPELVELIAARAAQLVRDQAAATDDASPYLTVDQAAEYLACKPKRIYDLTSQRRLPFVKDGSRTLLRRSDLDAYLEAST
jgi:excisionase family DNA binding protein